MRTPLLTLLAVGAAAGPAFAQAQILPKDDTLKGAEAKDIQGWNPSLAGTATVNVVSNSSVVGQVDGVSTLFGVGLTGGLDYVEDKHVLRTTLGIAESFARTPVVDDFVKTSDVVALEGLYNYFASSTLGGFGRLSLQTALFPATDVRGLPTSWVEKTATGSTPLATNAYRQRLAGSFAPFTINEAVGAFFEPIHGDDLSLSFRAGVGGRHTLADSVLLANDDKATPEIELLRLANVHQLGLEGFAGATGTLRDGKLAYKAGLSLLVPAVNNDKFSRSAGALTRIALEGQVTFNVFEWMSLVYSVAITRDPAARRRRVLALGGLVTVAALGSAAAVAAWGIPASVSCEHGAAAMDRAWGPGARAKVHQGLLASGVPFGDETWSRLEPRLEAYVEAWASTRDETCRAHHHGATSDRLYDRQVACLELRLASFDALVELLGNADPGAAARSLAAAASLPAAPACIGAVALTDAVAPPEGAELAREVEAQRRRLARVVELEALGRYAEGRQEARAVVDDAERLRYRPLLAEALVRDGSLAMEHGAPSEAEDLLTAALGHALATDHVDVAIEATARRIFVRAERMRTPERAEDDVASGAGLLDRVGGDPRLRTLYLNNVGSFHIRRNAPEAARRVLEQALEVGSTLGSDEPSRVQTLGNLAIAEERAGLDEPARTHLAEALELARQALGPHHPTVAELARLRGELLLRTGHLLAAQAALQEVLELLRAAVGPRSPLHHAPLVLLGELALEERRHAFADRRNTLLPALRDIGFQFATEPQGAFYLYADISGLADSSETLAQRLIEEAGVATTPGLDFGDNAPERHLRIAYTTDKARLREAAERIGRVLQQR